VTDQELQQKRLIAAAIDVAIAVAIGVVFAVATMALAVGGGVIAGRDGGSAMAAGAGAGMLSRVLGLVGALVGFVYVVGRDVFAGGRSFGKQAMGLRVITSSGAPCGLVDSAKRNAIFAIGSGISLVGAVFMLIPCLGEAMSCLLILPRILAGLLGVAALIVEIVKIVTDPAGIRFGDQFAGTRVVR